MVGASICKDISNIDGRLLDLFTVSVILPSLLIENNLINSLSFGNSVSPSDLPFSPSSSPVCVQANDHRMSECVPPNVYDFRSSRVCRTRGKLQRKTSIYSIGIIPSSLAIGGNLLQCVRLSVLGVSGGTPHWPEPGRNHYAYSSHGRFHGQFGQDI